MKATGSRKIWYLSLKLRRVASRKTAISVIQTNLTLHVVQLTRAAPPVMHSCSQWICLLLAWKRSNLRVSVWFRFRTRYQIWFWASRRLACVGILQFVSHAYGVTKMFGVFIRLSEISSEKRRRSRLINMYGLWISSPVAVIIKCRRLPLAWVTLKVRWTTLKR